MHWEAYNVNKHGITGKMPHVTRSEWQEMFAAATREPIVVRGVQRQTMHASAKRLGYKIVARSLADTDGLVVQAVKVS